MASEWPAWLWVDDTTAYDYDPRGQWTPDDEPENDSNAPTTRLYLHRDAARAWQAFRDWLNGVGDRVLIEGATFKGPRPGAWLTIDPKTGAQTFDLRGATITYGGSDD